MTSKDARHARILNLLDQNSSRPPSARHESNNEGARGQSRHVDDVFASLDPTTFDQYAHKYPTEFPDPAAVKKALDLLQKHGRTGYAKLQTSRSLSKLDRLEVAALETVVRADGTRPSFLIRNGKVPQDHPLIGTWAGKINNTAANIHNVCGGIGRIQPKGGGPKDFFGTGSLVEAEQGLVLTNYHVYEAIIDHDKTRHSPNPRDASRITIKDGVFIDFNGEIDQLSDPQFRVVEIILPEGSGSHEGGIDAAILKIDFSDPNAGAEMPSPVRLSPDTNAATGAMNSFCLIGFPGRPQYEFGIIDGINWDWVTTTLFGNLFGLKRLSPGETTDPAGSYSPPFGKGVFGHDASTLGGSSGSLLHSWVDDGAPGIALHFAGSDEGKTNLCTGIYAIREQLRKVGVPI